MNTLKVFEYERLHVNEIFTIAHLNALALYNEEYGGIYFKLGYNSVYFQQFVGVLKVGDLTIEILPKIGKESTPGSNPDKWQKVLLDMLQMCNWMNVHSNAKAHLQYKYNSILEAYFDLFIRECEYLVQLGLIKKYRQTEGNKVALKGKLLFGKNIQHNIVHQERFYTRHQVYDRNNIFNQILFKTLNLIPTLTNNPFLTDRIYSLLFSFPEMDDIKVNSSTFSNLLFDRKSTVYEEAIQIAAMILLNYRPDIQTGQNHVLAILFDMNDLWEEYVYRQLLYYCDKETNIEPQVYKKVWLKENANRISKGIKPDIVLHRGEKTLIIDTKWKLPEDDIPADADLKQMFMYNEFWVNANAVLLYPKETGNIIFDSGFFLSNNINSSINLGIRHKCGLLKVSVLSNNLTQNSVLDAKFGRIILDQLAQVNLI